MSDKINGPDFDRWRTGDYGERQLESEPGDGQAKCAECGEIFTVSPEPVCPNCGLVYHSDEEQVASDERRIAITVDQFMYGVLRLRTPEELNLIVDRIELAIDLYSRGLLANGHKAPLLCGVPAQPITFDATGVHASIGDGRWPDRFRYFHSTLYGWLSAESGEVEL